MNPILFVGPFPPPTHGQAIATNMLAEHLEAQGCHLRKIDLSIGDHNKIISITYKILKYLFASKLILSNKSLLYISLSANAGMWLSAVLVALARLRRNPTIVHHLTYDHVRRRRLSMAALVRAGGSNLLHVVLTNSMGKDLKATYKEAKNLIVINNSGIVRTYKIEKIRSNNKFIIGHLANICKEKGIKDVVDLAIQSLHNKKLSKLIIAGPIKDKFSENEIERAKLKLEDHFEYRGPVYGDDKIKFFSDIDYFIFPTRYRNEASPLVLLEAIAAGIPCITTNIAGIPEIIEGSGGCVLNISENFIKGSLDYFDNNDDEYMVNSQKSKKRFEDLLIAYGEQIDDLSYRLCHVSLPQI
ncbi:glycosyltransferase family 4 protein [Amaricoccus macauensis]|uniref:glycosyltransferase family 4 protein n=1 Tax=Amaricoccus macauensis TaxID=57001 RepID=UPI003C79F5B2